MEICSGESPLHLIPLQIVPSVCTRNTSERLRFHSASVSFFFSITVTRMVSLFRPTRRHSDDVYDFFRRRLQRMGQGNQSPQGETLFVSYTLSHALSSLPLRIRCSAVYLQSPSLDILQCTQHPRDIPIILLPESSPL